MFREYMHVERFGNDEVQGIELGECYIFPKLDGTNASVWIDGSYNIHAGSRKREVTLGSDNAGFAKFALNDARIKCFLLEYPWFRLYGEWLVPHTIKAYNKDAWRKFYVFDVFNHELDSYIPYSEYKACLEKHDIDYIPAYSIMKNATYDHFLIELNKNDFLMSEGVGEGIVIKNYNYKNKYGRTTWAKLVTSTFKETHKRVMGPDEKRFSDLIEEKIVDEFFKQDIVEKVYAKISNDEQGWNSKYIPRLLGTVYHDFVTEELWQGLKKHKNPTINFKTLNSLIVNKTKESLPHVFN